MKSLAPEQIALPMDLSHSVWSAWIEIYLLSVYGGLGTCRTPYGVRGLKSKRMSKF
ncbi:hypothetical protein [Paenibacillus xylanivorans]|uniref:hypothetical protein n=1 Tax=Paenibacillus xylanivorans TaxID=1705561 RepID=UPI000ABCA953